MYKSIEISYDKNLKHVRIHLDGQMVLKTVKTQLELEIKFVLKLGLPARHMKIVGVGVVVQGITRVGH